MAIVRITIGAISLKFIFLMIGFNFSGFLSTY